MSVIDQGEMGERPQCRKVRHRLAGYLEDTNSQIWREFSWKICFLIKKKEKQAAVQSSEILARVQVFDVDHSHVVLGTNNNCILGNVR